MKLIILDRDGVINRDSDQFIKSPEEWQPIDGSLDAIAFLTQAGYAIAVATTVWCSRRAVKSAAFGFARTWPTAIVPAASPSRA